MTEGQQPAETGKTGGDTRRGGGTRAIAVTALIAALTSAFWAPPLYQFMQLRTPTAAKLARQDVEVGRLNQTVADLERKMVDLTAAVAKAEQEAAAARAAQTAAEARDGVLALVQLQSALRRPGPFDVELALARAANPDLGDLAPLLVSIERYASTGILVPPQLRQEFRAVADEVRRHDFKVIPVAWFNSLLGRQQTGDQPAPVPPMERASAVIDRAQEQLTTGNLRSAVVELGSLNGDAATLVEAWMSDARARLAADLAVGRLSDRIAATLPQTAPSQTSLPQPVGK